MSMYEYSYANYIVSCVHIEKEKKSLKNKKIKLLYFNFLNLDSQISTNLYYQLNTSILRIAQLLKCFATSNVGATSLTKSHQ